MQPLCTTSNELSSGNQIGVLSSETDDKLLSSESTDHATIAYILSEKVPDSGEDRIASQMTVRIVDLLEMIDIDQQNPGRLSEPFTLAQNLFPTIEKRLSPKQACQFIHERDSFQGVKDPENLRSARLKCDHFAFEV